MSESARTPLFLTSSFVMLFALACEGSHASPAQTVSPAVVQSLRSAVWSDAPGLGSDRDRGPVALAGVAARTRCGHRRSIEGTWVSEAYGLALEASANEFVLYQVSETSCFVDAAGTLDNPCEPELPIELGSDEAPRQLYVQTQVRGPRLIVSDAATTRYEFTRTRRLPASCRAGRTPPSVDPELNFELFYEHFREHYAFFALRGVNWDAQYARYRPQVDAGTRPERLFQILTEMVAPLRDYHVSITSDTQRFVRQPPSDIAANADVINALLRARYLEAPAVTAVGNGLLTYRMLGDGIGYVGIWAMTGFADPAALSAGEDLVASELEGARAAIDEALAALGSATALVVDVRFNGGGMDGVALTIANRFADRRRVAYHKAARVRRSLTAWRPFHVEPAGVPFEGPVALLTSRVTLSAAEIFVMAMRVLPNVVVVGEPTAGAHSDVMERTLANGWELGLSNEVYVLADGAVYEGRGIPPSVSVPLDAAAFGVGRDVIAERASELLRR